MKRKCKEINGKRIQYHRWVVEQFLGRKLIDDEIVHHIDGNEYNNDISNLRIMSMSEHCSYHKSGKSSPKPHGWKPMNTLSYHVIKDILQLWDDGIKNYSIIAKRLKLSDMVVRRYILEYRRHTP